MCRSKSDPTAAIKREIDELISEANEVGIITNQLYNFLLSPFPLTPLFYILPKIHKTLVDPPGRPIVAGTNSVFQPLAILLDQAKQIIYKHWHVLCSDPTLSTTFKDPPVCAFKRSKNLRDTLVHARSNPQPTTNTTNWLSSLPAPTD
ncbi:uncharacterized protein [Hyperolius riggenbachi]|uniref:uncharacterized protein isoform X3 n=1 Tax=Hyperolius riggenbachi TaxID=752182 RepID=UPI0035A3AE07